MVFWDVLKKEEENLSGDFAQRQYGNRRRHSCGTHCSQYSYSGCITLSLRKGGVQKFRGMKAGRKDKGKNKKATN